MTIQIANNLVRTRKKDLTIVALLLIMARGTFKKNRRRTTTGAPAPKISRSQAFFQEIFGDCVPRGTSESWHDFCLRKMFSKNSIERLPKLLNQSQ